MSRVKQAYEAGKVAALEKFAGPYTDAAKRIGGAGLAWGGLGAVVGGMSGLMTPGRRNETWKDHAMRGVRGAGVGALESGLLGALLSTPYHLSEASDRARISWREAQGLQRQTQDTPSGREVARRAAGMEQRARPSSAQDLTNFQVAPTPYPMPGTSPATTATNTSPFAPQEVQDLGARFRGLDIAPPSAGGAHPDDLAEALARFRALELD